MEKNEKQLYTLQFVVGACIFPPFYDMRVHYMRRRTHTHTHTHTHVCEFIYISVVYVCMYVCMCVCVCVCIYICIHVYLSMYMCMYMYVYMLIADMKRIHKTQGYTCSVPSCSSKLELNL
jgi:hypothetical protein